MPKRKAQFLAQWDFSDMRTRPDPEGRSSQGPQLLAPRKDAPVLNLSSRADRGAALAAATDKDAALTEYEAVEFAQGSAAAQLSCWKTWCEFHSEWFRDDTFLPITPEKIKCISAMARRGNYRSWPNYLSQAKLRHIRAGFMWTQALSLEAVTARRAVMRGIGPARQSAPLDLPKVVECSETPTSVIEGGPINSVAALHGGSFFMLREIELSLALCRSLHLDPEALTATLLLPASKTDTQALSVSRTWACTCARAASNLCVYHRLSRHMDLLLKQFGDPLPEKLPVFPSCEGQPVTKEKMVATIEEFARRTGSVLHDATGRRRFGGHSLRVTGAQYFSSIGLGETLISLLARWTSPTILRYIRDAPLQALDSEFGKAMTSVSMRCQARPDVERILLDLKDMLAQTCLISDQLKGQLAEEAQFRKRVSDLEKKVDSETNIVNLESGVLHKTLRNERLVPPALWKTQCGWPYAFSSFAHQSMRDQRAVKSLCDRCFRDRDSLDPLSNHDSGESDGE